MGTRECATLRSFPFRMAGSKVIQAIAFGVVGLALVVMAVGLMNESEQGDEFIAAARDPALSLRGEALLRSQAAKLDAKRAAAKKGQGLNAVDSMVSGWRQEDSDESEEKNDLKKFDKGLALDPKAMGIVTFNKDGTPNLNLLQQDSTWTPSGQQGLDGELKQAHHEQENTQRKEDGLKGDDVLSSVGLEGDEKKDSDSYDDLQLIQEEDDSWEPQGQSGLSGAIRSAHEAEAAKQIKRDGLKGNGVLASVGMESAGTSTEEEDPTDIGDLFGHDSESSETEFMQEWKPKEEKAEANDLVPYKAKKDEDFSLTADEKDGGEAGDILGAVGIKNEDDKEDEVEKLGTLTTDDIQLVQQQGIAKKFAAKVGKAVKKLKNKVVKVSKAVAKKAVAVSKKVAGRFAKKKSVKKVGKKLSKQVMKNILFLKVYSTLVVDKVVDNSRHLGALGLLLKAMAVKSKHNAVQQYVNAMRTIAQSASRGLPKYTLQHVAKVMNGKGLVVMAPVRYRPGVFVRLDGKDLGLQESYPLLGKLAVRVNTFVTEMAKMKKKIDIDLKSKQHSTLEDFNRLFRPTCVGAGAAFDKCAKKSQKTCGKPCKWVSGWDGSLQTPITQVLASINE